MDRPDKNCVSLPNGDCIAKGVCLHSVREELTDDEVIVYDDLIVTHVKAIEDGLIHSDETPLSEENMQ